MRLPSPVRGLTVRTVRGATVSTKKSRDAGLGSATPVSVTARTRIPCGPSASGSVVNGDAQAVNAARSTEHSNVAPAAGSAANPNVGVASLVGPSGPEVNRVSLTSVRYVRAAEQPDTLPAASVAVARKVTLPLAGADTVNPCEAKAAAPPLAATGSEQSGVVYSRTVEPASAVPMTLGSVSVFGLGGEVPVIVGGAGGVVSGSAVSKVRVAPVAVVRVPSLPNGRHE